MPMELGGDQVDERRAMSWMFQLSDALGYLHGRKIVHRDLKPANVRESHMSRAEPCRFLD
jgi:serine/threonine protein kinase